MKKILCTLMIVALIIPFIPITNAKASTTKNQSTPGKLNSIGQKAIFYAVSEKSGIQFSGANGGANNFFDALRQSNYELHKGNNPKFIKEGETLTQRFEKIKTELSQKPTPVRPGVGKILITGYAFSLLSEIALNSFETWVNGLASGHNIKVMEEIIAENSDGVAISEIPGLMRFTTTSYQNMGKTWTYHTVVTTNKGKTSNIVMPLSIVAGTESIRAYRGADRPTDFNGDKNPLATFLVVEMGLTQGNGDVVQTASKTVYLVKSELDELGHNVVEREPKSLGTLTNPSWDTGSETDIPGFVELEVPITEDGEVDLDRQLSPDNPAINDPKKPLKPTAPGEDTPPGNEDEDTKKPVPNLTPKPNPNTNPLPNPSPLPSPTPTEPTTPPAEGSPISNPGDTGNRWGQLVTNKFPFSLPWDIGYMISPLMADPKRPNVDLDVSFSVFGKTVPIKFSHDFEWMDDYIVFVRTFILIGFNIFLITGTRRLMGGGQ